MRAKARNRIARKARLKRGVEDADGGPSGQKMRTDEDKREESVDDHATLEMQAVKEGLKRAAEQGH